MAAFLFCSGVPELVPMWLSFRFRVEEEDMIAGANGHKGGIGSCPGVKMMGGFHANPPSISLPSVQAKRSSIPFPSSSSRRELLVHKQQRFT